MGARMQQCTCTACTRSHAHAHARGAAPRSPCLSYGAYVPPPPRRADQRLLRGGGPADAPGALLLLQGRLEAACGRGAAGQVHHGPRPQAGGASVKRRPLSFFFVHRSDGSTMFWSAASIAVMEVRCFGGQHAYLIPVAGLGVFGLSRRRCVGCAGAWFVASSAVYASLVGRLPQWARHCAVVSTTACGRAGMKLWPNLVHLYYWRLDVALLVGGHVRHTRQCGRRAALLVPHASAYPSVQLLGPHACAIIPMQPIITAQG